MSLYFVVYVLSNMFLVYIIRKFVYLFYEKCRLNKFVEFSIYSLHFILLTSTFLFFRNSLFNIIFNICSIFSVTLIYDNINIKKSIGITVVLYLILFTVEASIVILINLSRFYDVTLNYYKNMTIHIISSVLLVVFYNVMYIKKVNFKKIDIIFSNKHSYLFMIFPFLSLCLVIIGAVFFDNITLVIILNLFILFLNVVLFKYYNYVLMSYKRIFNKISNDRLTSYKKDLKFCINMADLDNCTELNDSVIYEILNSRIGNLVDSEVKLKINISLEETLHIDLNDLLIIIGNLIDNAISGVKSTLENNEKYINISIKNVKGTVILSVKNSFNGRKFYDHEIFFKKSREFKNYGFGLLSVLNIVEKHNGFLRAKFNKNNFEIYILLYDMGFI